MTPALSSQRSTWLSILWVLAFYQLQHCVIYCHTTDTNAWYTRRAKRYGAYAGEIESGDDTDE